MAEPEKATCSAILSHTLVRSPVVRSIHAARIRHHTRNDVLFISADEVHIKEAHRDYTLEPVLIKSDFDAMIRNSGVFGLPRKSQKPIHMRTRTVGSTTSMTSSMLKGNTANIFFRTILMTRK